MTKSLIEEIRDVYIAVIPSSLTFIALFIIIKIIPDEGIFYYILNVILGITAFCTILMVIIIIICAPISLVRRRRQEHQDETPGSH